MKDLAALTGGTGREFAVFTKGNRAIIVHGGGKTWNIGEDARKKIMDEKWLWEGHSHPMISIKLNASDSDIARKFPKQIPPRGEGELTLKNQRKYVWENM